jgi:hypothetical protein
LTSDVLLTSVANLPSLAGPDDPYYEHAIKKARYKFELQEIEQYASGSGGFDLRLTALTTFLVVCRREEQYATLQAKLEELRQNSSLLKKKAIIADSSLTELHEVSVRCLRN